MHSFKSQFSAPFDRYNNRLTAHAYTIEKGLLLLKPHSWACLTSMGARMVQADSRQVTLQDWLAILGIDVATFCDMWS